MKSGLVRYKDVQEQAVAVVRQEWPQVRSEARRFSTWLMNFKFLSFSGIAGTICNLRARHRRLASKPIEE